MKSLLLEDALSNMLITAHRGVAGGNIPCNTLAAYDAAILQGADMIEMDVSASADGVLFAFHPGMEPVHLRADRYISQMTADEVSQLRFVNQDGTPTALKVNTFDEVLEHLKGRCYINVDKYRDNVVPITKAIRRHAMEQQILVKTAPDEGVFRMMEEVAPDISYMVMVRDKDELSPYLAKRKLSYIGVEALFADETSEFASSGYVRRMNAQGLIVWANAIVYDYKSILSAGHNDDVSVTGAPDDGWGWLMDRGYNIIQTDWPLPLRIYSEKRKARDK